MTEVPSLAEKEWTPEERAAAEAFMQTMGDDPTIFAKGPGSGRFMRCIRAALTASERLTNSPAERAKLRPANYWQLPTNEQWAIDRQLRILDWEPPR